MEIDVYMKELYYEQIDQQVAYDLTNLWSKFVTAVLILKFCLNGVLLYRG